MQHLIIFKFKLRKSPPISCSLCWLEKNKQQLYTVCMEYGEGEECARVLIQWLQPSGLGIIIFWG